MAVSWFLFPLGILKCPLTHLTLCKKYVPPFSEWPKNSPIPLNCIFVISSTITWSNMHHFLSMLFNVIIINMHLSI